MKTIFVFVSYGIHMSRDIEGVFETEAGVRAAAATRAMAYRLKTRMDKKTDTRMVYIDFVDQKGNLAQSVMEMILQ